MTLQTSEGCPQRIDAARQSLFSHIRGRLIVSCQSRPGEPLYGPVYMAEMPQEWPERAAR